jgi:hypothetical protein
MELKFEEEVKGSVQPGLENLRRRLTTEKLDAFSHKAGLIEKIRSDNWSVKFKSGEEMVMLEKKGESSDGEKMEIKASTWNEIKDEIEDLSNPLEK